jgi:hypothetical protein
MANKPVQNGDKIDGAKMKYENFGFYGRNCKFSVFSSIIQAEKIGFTDIDEYFMGHKKRGIAIVINNKDFQPNTSEFFLRIK